MGAYGTRDLAEKAVKAGIGDKFQELQMNRGAYFLVKGYSHWRVELSVTGKIVKIEQCSDIDHFGQAAATVDVSTKHGWVLIVRMWAINAEEINDLAKEAFERWLKIDYNSIIEVEEELKGSRELA